MAALMLRRSDVFTRNDQTSLLRSESHCAGFVGNPKQMATKNANRHKKFGLFVVAADFYRSALVTSSFGSGPVDLRGFDSRRAMR